MPRSTPFPGRVAVPQGFTLLELLVVISIILLFLGLTIGAVMRTPTINKLIGTEQMMADVVRQARHTARSTGSPVEVTISKANRAIMGVSQIPVWNATFDDNDAQYTPYLTNLGQTGSGLWCPPDPSGTPLYPAPVVLTPAQSLARNPTVLDGFYLAAAVDPPDVNGAQDVEPLLQIGNEDDSKCCCGLALWNEVTPVQQVTALVGTPPPTITAAYSSWDVVGWINDSNGYHAVRSIEDSIITPATYLPTNAMDVAGPIVGNRWEEFGLLYDGHVLELYRNGRVIARNPNPNSSGTSTFSGVPANPAACAGPISIAEGTFSSLPNLFGGSPIPKRTLQGTLDNLRLLRLGTDRAANLPSGVTPDNDYQLTVRPDGIVENNQTSPHTLGATITFQIMGEVSAGAVIGLDTAVISIASDGSVSSLTNASTVTAPVPAP